MNKHEKPHIAASDYTGGRVMVAAGSDYEGGTATVTERDTQNTASGTIEGGQAYLSLPNRLGDTFSLELDYVKKKGPKPAGAADQKAEETPANPA